MLRIFKFKKAQDARTFTYLLSNANFDYTSRRFQKNDRKGTIIYEVTVHLTL
jgi:hypothetical protein